MNLETPFDFIFGATLPFILRLFLIAPFVLLAVVVPASIAFNFFQRRMVADVQARVGPNLVGMGGVIQPIVDGLKLIGKRSADKLTVNSTVFTLISLILLFFTPFIVPLGTESLLAVPGLSLFIPVWIVLLNVLFAFIYAFRQSRWAEFFSGFRLVSQTLTGVFSALVSLLAVAISVGGYSWEQVIAFQGADPFSWLAFKQPFQVFSLVSFFLSGLVIFSLPPFEAAFSKISIFGGLMADFYGFSLIIARLVRFYVFFLWSIVTIVLFFGGWTIPEFVKDAFLENRFLIFSVEMLCLMLKVFALMLLTRLISKIIPLTRVDHSTDFVWKVLSPMALLGFFGALFWNAS